ncbi:class C sortase [Eubacterium barkeri]|uniref:Sortase A n=1 Tax=Eubacterium barkeri TaxID=1528 RepID=A0A1H3ESF5_EUBBA|nr:class C sortase [Eubacterium barkeri]SDX81686.1 sortase A [Eubacterium barkeri]
MKKKLVPALLFICLLSGLTLLAYPAISNALRDRQQDQVWGQYDLAVAALSEAERQAVLSDARTYNSTLADSAVLTDPFDPDVLRTLETPYRDLLNPKGNSIMGILSIPSISVSEAIYHGTSDSVLSTGVGHLENTSLPVGGRDTHAVISGHAGLPGARIFTDLDSLEIGDVFYLDIIGEHLIYQVRQKKVVDPQDLGDLRIQPGEDLVTLVTCTPPGINSQRLLVQGSRLSESQRMPEAQKESFTLTFWQLYSMVLILGTIVSIGCGILLFRRK